VITGGLERQYPMTLHPCTTQRRLILIASSDKEIERCDRSGNFFHALALDLVMEQEETPGCGKEATPRRNLRVDFAERGRRADDDFQRRESLRLRMLDFTVDMLIQILVTVSQQGAHETPKLRALCIIRGTSTADAQRLIQEAQNIIYSRQEPDFLMGDSVHDCMQPRHSGILCPAGPSSNM
jgi:hypothetical protein